VGPRVYVQDRQDTTLKAATGCLHQLVNRSHWIQAINVKKQCDCDVRPSVRPPVIQSHNHITHHLERPVIRLIDLRAASTQMVTHQEY